MECTFPPIEPFDSGMLDVGQGHRLYWERCGNPEGRPALYLHGAPAADPRRARGATSTPNFTRPSSSINVAAVAAGRSPAMSMPT